MGNAEEQECVKKKSFYSSLLFQVSVGMIIGVTLGFVYDPILIECS